MSHKFQKEVKPILKKYGYSFNSGTLTDCGELTIQTGICSANVSCGYYAAHTEYEVVYIKQSIACYLLMSEVVEQMSYKQWTIKVKRPVYNTGYYGSGWDWNKWEPVKEDVSESDEEEFMQTNIPCPKCKKADLIFAYDYEYCEHCNYYKYINNYE